MSRSDEEALPFGIAPLVLRVGHELAAALGKSTPPETPQDCPYPAFRSRWPTRWPGVDLFAQLHRQGFGLTTSVYPEPEIDPMASLLHETIVELLAEHPELLVPALQEQLGDLPVDLEFHRTESTQSQVPALRLDLALEARRRGEALPFAALTVEVQLSKDPDKPYSWLLYHAGQHYRLRVPSYLVVITSNPDVAAWAAGPFSSGMVTMRPLVITPDHFPPITDAEEAKRSLERTFLSGMVHASEPVAADIGRALRAALDASIDDIGLCYWDTLLAVVGDAVRSTLEMEMKSWKPRSEWGKRLLADAKGEGRVEGRAESVVDLLDLRGISLDPPLRQRITTCTDYELLTQWLRRAATATSAEEVFAT